MPLRFESVGDRREQRDLGQRVGVKFAHGNGGIVLARRLVRQRVRSDRRDIVESICFTQSAAMAAGSSSLSTSSRCTADDAQRSARSAATDFMRFWLRATRRKRAPLASHSRAHAMADVAPMVTMFFMCRSFVSRSATA